VTIVVLAAAGLGAPVALAFNPVVEQENFSKTQERQTIYLTPQYQALLAEVSAQNLQAALAIQRGDAERQFYTDLWLAGRQRLRR
jgi:hypothetical protein